MGRSSEITRRVALGDRGGWRLLLLENSAHGELIFRRKTAALPPALSSHSLTQSSSWLEDTAVPKLIEDEQLLRQKQQLSAFAKRAFVWKSVSPFSKEEQLWFRETTGKYIGCAFAHLVLVYSELL